MKSIWITSLIILFAGCTTTPVNINSPLIGKWSGTDEKNITGSFVFERNGEVSVSVSGESLMSAEQKALGVRTIFELDAIARPERFDVFAVFQGRKSPITSCIYRFLNPDEIQIRCSQGGAPLPTAFESGEASHAALKLFRQKP
ncbi:hypothetical protein [Viridibacterium curvum]|uniref:Lipoprotein n=1 Tax=Viridibacterium curvum TaxID=1101404 RepID=A0ABP9QS27_9RHOO